MSDENDPKERGAVSRTKEILSRIDAIEKNVKLLAESVKALETETEIYTIPAGTEMYGIKFD